MLAACDDEKDRPFHEEVTVYGVERGYDTAKEHAVHTVALRRALRGHIESGVVSSFGLRG